MSKTSATTPAAIQDYIKASELVGLLDPQCRMCQEVFYPAVRQGQLVGNIFAPRHRASDRCRSGKHPHCTCDTCF